MPGVSTTGERGPASKRLEGRVALVTGSTTGIGEAIARRFAAEGAFVMTHGRRQAEAERVVTAIESDGSGRAAYTLADLALPESADYLVEQTVKRAGRLDILVNNAAVMARGDLETTTSDLFDRTIAVNLRAPMLLARAAIPHLRAATGGVVLNIGSVNGYCGERNQLAYSLSKGGLMTLSRNLADAYGPEGVRVHHFNVGWVLTPGEHHLKQLEGLPQEWPTSLPSAFAPSGQLLTPEDIAHFALAFVDRGAGAVSGVVVDLEQYPVIGRNPSKDMGSGSNEPASGPCASVLAAHRS